MSLWLIDSNGNRYDFIRADLAGFPVAMRRNLITLAFAHGARDIGDQKIDPRRLEVATLLKGTTGGMVRQLFHCESISGWTGAVDGLTPVLDSTYIKQGTYSLKLGIDADKNPEDYGRWENLQTFGDLSSYQTDYLRCWFYFPDLTYIEISSNCFQIGIGSSPGNYDRWNIAKSSLSAGWNLIECDLDDPSVTIGSPDWTAIDFFKILIKTVASNTHDFEIYVDDLKIWRVSYQAEFDDLMRWVGRTDLKFYKDTSRYINVESMDLKNHSWIVGDAKSKATLELFCPDPFWYADDETTEDTWTVSASPDTNDIMNKGNIDVFPVIEITAAADLSGGIEIENQSDGSVLFSYVDSNFTSGKKLTIDCVNGTVDLDGTDTFRFFEGQFLRLLAGSNTLQYTGGDCSIVVKHRDRWL